MKLRARRRWIWLGAVWAVLVVTGGILTLSWQEEPKPSFGWREMDDESGSAGRDAGYSGNPMHGSLPSGPPSPSSPPELYGELVPSLKAVPDKGFLHGPTRSPLPLDGESGPAPAPSPWRVSPSAR
ncbi:hypothetical protein [Streptomyces sp. 891-h]|uniref:hypothetical protein n=1 Tax=Streptomyces sp. 891-h TaxID=2720714 RepID=UPI001FAAAEAA|nr:hypothetical protein [Streptomyces sp. 891-h]UNZ17206.1 hypothetical protein HC362_09175 [Streptomyces sp. 891-h]